MGPPQPLPPPRAAAAWDPRTAPAARPGAGPGRCGQPRNTGHGERYVMLRPQYELCDVMSCLLYFIFNLPDITFNIRQLLQCQSLDRVLELPTPLCNTVHHDVITI